MAFIEKISDALNQPLPGEEAQWKMAHASRQNYHGPTSTARQAGVLLLLFPKDDLWHTLLIERVNNRNLNDVHRGQLAFPGGTREDEDTDLVATALREAEEEVGVPRDDIKVLGKLTSLFISVSNFMVHPIVGMVEKQPKWTLQRDEVAGVIEFPIDKFRDPTLLATTSIKVSQNIKLLNVPYFDLNGKVLWGATAMMMQEFIELNW